MDDRNMPEPIHVQGIDADDEQLPPVEGEAAEGDDQLDSLPAVVAKTLSDPGADMGELDESTLNPDFDYRWVHNSPAKIYKRLGRGWTFVRKSEDNVEKVYESPEEGADDFVRSGDRVLMKIQKDIHSIQKKRIAAVTKSRLGSPKGDFRKKARQAGTKASTRSYRGEPSD